MCFFNSDILAELDLPASGISRFEDRLYTEAGLFISANELQTPDPLTMIYYLAQIHLRKVLNRVHTELYKAECTLLYFFKQLISQFFAETI